MLRKWVIGGWWAVVTLAAVPSGSWARGGHDAGAAVARDPTDAQLAAAMAAWEAAANEPDPDIRRIARHTAIDAMEQVARRTPSRPRRSMALFNRCAMLGSSGEHAAAIAACAEVVASDADDRDPGENLMDPYRNYRYRALMVAASSQMALGRRVRAVDAAFDALRAYQSDCANCWMEVVGRFERDAQEMLQAIDRGVTAEDVASALETRGEMPSRARFWRRLTDRLRSRRALWSAIALDRALDADEDDLATVTEARARLGNLGSPDAGL